MSKLLVLSASWFPELFEILLTPLHALKIRISEELDCQDLPTEAAVSIFASRWCYVLLCAQTND